MGQSAWTWVWRIAVLAVLGWIAVELHLFRSDSPMGLDYATERTLDDIERNTHEAVELLRRSR